MRKLLTALSFGLGLLLLPLASPAALAREKAPPSSFRSALEDDAGAGTYRHFVNVRVNEPSGDRVLLSLTYLSLFSLLVFPALVVALDRRWNAPETREIELKHEDEAVVEPRRAA